jgi:O-antigen/teichoic acid export membrane protein
MLLFTGAHACLTVCGYIVVVVLARGLGPSEYGIYGIVLSVLLSVELIGRLGIPQALSKLIAERQDQTSQLEGTGLTLTFLVFTGIFLLFWAAAPLMAELFQIAGGTSLFRIASIDIPFFGMYFICSHILNGRRRFGLESLGISLYGLAKAVGILVLLYLGLSVQGALVVNIVSSVIALIVVAVPIPRASFRPTLRFAGLVFRWAVPVGLFILGTQLLFNLHLWCLKVVGRTLPEETIGVYVAAISVARLPNIASFALMAVLIPSISHALGGGDTKLAQRYVHGAVRFLVAILLPACLLIAMKAGPIMELLYSSRYTNGALSCSILIFGLGFLYTILTTFCAILIAEGSPKASAAATLGMVPLGWIMSVILILRHGAAGAAVSATLAMGAGVLITGYMVQRSFGPMITGMTLLRIGIATFVMAAAASRFSFGGLLLVLECAGLLAVYIFVLGLLGEFRREDVELIIPKRGRIGSDSQTDDPHKRSGRTVSVSDSQDKAVPK